MQNTPYSYDNHYVAVLIYSCPQLCIAGFEAALPTSIRTVNRNLKLKLGPLAGATHRETQWPFLVYLSFGEFEFFREFSSIKTQVMFMLKTSNLKPKSKFILLEQNKKGIKLKMWHQNTNKFHMYKTPQYIAQDVFLVVPWCHLTEHNSTCDLRKYRSGLWRVNECVHLQFLRIFCHTRVHIHLI